MSWGSSHNRAPMPFSPEVGSTIDYKATKPSNWKPGEYTEWAPQNQAKTGWLQKKIHFYTFNKVKVL